jgi:lambda family phage minor tail protein L
MTVPVSDLQAIAPSAVIELFELELTTALHGYDDIIRFHAGSNDNNYGEIIWNGNPYLQFPVEAEGFEYTGNGQLPRPKLRLHQRLRKLKTRLTRRSKTCAWMRTQPKAKLRQLLRPPSRRD